MEGALADVAGTDPMFMTTADKRAALLGLDRAARGLDGLRLRLMAAADDVAEGDAVREPS